jgi:hypothetical protein
MTRKNLSRAEQLALYCENLEGAADYLRESAEVCAPLLHGTPYSRLELREFEAVTARFARLSDLLLQKVLRYVGTIEANDAGSIIDIMNRAEKQNIARATVFSSIRDVRNEIAHEYATRDIDEIARDVLRFSPELLAMTGRAIEYAKALTEKLP